MSDKLDISAQDEQPDGARRPWHEPGFSEMGRAQGGANAAGNEVGFPSQPSYLPS